MRGVVPSRYLEELYPPDVLRSEAEYPLTHTPSLLPLPQKEVLDKKLATSLLELAAKTTEFEEMREAAAQKEAQLAEQEASLAESKRRMEAMEEAHTTAESDATELHKELMSKLGNAEQKTAELETQLGEQERAHTEGHERMVALHRTDIAAFEQEFEEKQGELDTTTAELVEKKKSMRSLHNQVVEMRGNIRVYCRIRPLLAHETQSSEPVYSLPSSDGRELVLHGEGRKSADGCTTKLKSWDFKFDRVFGPQVDQAAVFDEVSPLVQVRTRGGAERVRWA